MTRHALDRHLRPAPDSPSGRLARAYNSPDRLEALAAIEALRADLDERALRLVIEARQRGVTWAAVGGAIGTTRQGAFNRFGGLIQRYEQAGLINGVPDDGDLVMDENVAQQRSAALVEPTRPLSAD